jgi:localization factor PodJL
MKLGVPWSVKGIRPEARETAKEAARRSGMSLGDWLNTIIIQQAEEEGVQSPSIDEDDDGGDELSTVHQRLDDITRRIEKLGRSGPEVYAPKRSRQEPDQLAELIGRLDRRLDQFAKVSPPPPPQMMPPAIPSTRLPPSLDRAVAEISARQRMLNGNVAPSAARMPALEPRLQTQGALAMAAPPVVAAPTPAPAPIPLPMPLPVQDLSGLEDQLRNITNQIETLRKPGVEQAINALRDELGEIGRTLNDAMPRRAIDAIEKQIQGLNQRIAEGRQAGVDTDALGGIEHGLAEVRDALRELTPAESLIGFNDAVAGLAHKIDLIVAQKDPATMAQLESAITTLREMSTHIASNETVRSLASQVQELGEKVEQMAHAGNFGEALNHLEQRIGSLSHALEASAQSGGAVPPRLEALVGSLSDKIEQIQNSRGNTDAFGHLEDRIVNLVEKLDASDSRLGHLEALERGLADLLMHVEANRDSGPRADPSPGVNDLKNDIARTQDALEAVHGTLGHVVDRLAMIEKDIRGDARPRAATESEAPLAQPMGRVAVRAVESPPIAAAMPEPVSPPPPQPPAAASPPQPAPRRMPQASQLPIDPDLPPDQPLEPGSGPPQLRANPAARIAASEAALGGSRQTAVPGGQSGFIAAARRAAQAAVQEPSSRAPRAESLEAYEPEAPSLRGKLIKRVKSLFVAASVIAIVIGTIQIAGNILKSDNPGAQTAQAPAANTDQVDTAASNAAPEPVASIPVNPLALPKLPAVPPLAMPTGNTPIATVPPYGFAAPAMPSLLSPPMLGTRNDVTGSISRPANNPSVSPKQPSVQLADRLPAEIGGAHLRSAAVAGDPNAAYEIGVRFAEGHGVPANLEEAARWYERAASKGLVPAQFRYASLLEKGQGVKKDLAQARRLYLAAATKGNGKAMHNLAVLYAEGIDGKPDYNTAVQWFRKASQRGIADSQYNLGVLCARGLGTAKSYPEAYKWFALAAAQGDKESARKRDDLAAHMDPAELAVAQNEIKNFVAEPQPEQATVVPEPPGGWDHVSGAPPRARAQPTGPLALGSFQVGKR